MTQPVSTLAELLHFRAEKNPGDPALRTRQDGAWVDQSWQSLRDRADVIAAGIITVLDLDDHDVIGLIGQTSADWIACDFAGLSAGLQTVPIYASLHAEEVGYAHVDTGVKLVIVDDADQLKKVRAMRDGFTFFDKSYPKEDIPLRHIVVIDPTGIEAADDWESLADLEERGQSRLEEVRADLERRRSAAKPDETATYTYTSGTTGAPKAVIQTHTNHLAMQSAAAESGVLINGMSEGGLFLFLPLAHSFGRMIEFAGAYNNLPLVLSSVPTLADDVRSSRPGFFPGAPRVYEKMKSKVESAVSTASPIRKALFAWAIGVGEKAIPYRSRARPLPLGLKISHAIADRVVLSKLRERLGFDRAAALLTGSAPIDVEVHRFFLACGCDLLEAYGLTETCPGLTANLPGQIKLGTVGKAFPRVTLKIADDGEVLAKGPNVTSGYLNRPDSTDAAFDAEGWFHTGDLGSLDDEGFLTITGRKKELIKTSGGKYIAPAKIEGMLKRHAIIQEAVVIGERRNFCVALIFIDPEGLEDWGPAEGVSVDPTSVQVASIVEKHRNSVNTDLASFETIKAVKIYPEPLSIENGFLTASLKVKRSVVEEHYSQDIDALYDEMSKQHQS